MVKIVVDKSAEKDIKDLFKEEFEKARKEGAINELEKIKEYCVKNKFYYYETNKEMWQYAKKRLKELEKGTK